MSKWNVLVHCVVWASPSAFRSIWPCQIVHEDLSPSYVGRLRHQREKQAIPKRVSLGKLVPSPVLSCSDVPLVAVEEQCVHTFVLVSHVWSLAAAAWDVVPWMELDSLCLLDQACQSPGYEYTAIISSEQTNSCQRIYQNCSVPTALCSL